jgi:tetratricopeptide (TPR) repeat protein
VALATGRELSELERQALLEPTNDELWGDLGDGYRAQGDNETALQYYLYALRIDPGDSEWQTSVAELGGMDQAIAMLSAGIESETDDESLGDLADMFMAAGRNQEACDAYARANQIDPGDSEWIDKIAGNCPDVELAPYEGGDYGGEYGGVEGGVEGGIAGMIGDSAYVDASSDLEQGKQALASGDKTAAGRFFDAALHTDPTDKEALSGMILATGRTATDILGGLTAQITGNDELWGDLGDAWLFVGDTARAREAYQKAATLDPGDGEWQRQLAILGPGGAAQ